MKSLASAAMAVMLIAGAVSAQQFDVITGPQFITRVVSGTAFVTTTAAPFTNFTTTTVYVPPGDALVAARFSAESRCAEVGGTSSNWCEVRILIDGVEASPTETIIGADFAFDSTDNGASSLGAYRSHSMDRARCVTNSSAATIPVTVEVEWGVTNNDGGSTPSFWLDDWTLTVTVNRACLDQTG